MKPALSVFTLILLLLSDDTSAHDLFRAYVQHKIRRAMGAREWPKTLNRLASLKLYCR